MTTLKLADVQPAMAVAEKIHAGDPLTLGERRFIVSWIQKVADDVLDELRPRARARPNLDRDFFVAMDFYTTTPKRNRRKAVATRWKLSPTQVATIASRWRKECERKLEDRPENFWRKVVEMKRAYFVSARS